MRYIAWTGGYDSTYLIATALAAGDQVQPVYIACGIDGRRSQGQEWQTVHALWPLLHAQYPGLLQPTEIVYRIEPAAIAEVSPALVTANQLLPIRHRITGQYEALAAYAHESGHILEVAAEQGGGSVVDSAAVRGPDGEHHPGTGTARIPAHRHVPRSDGIHGGSSGCHGAAIAYMEL
jgi:hypothetical protein